ncbi:fimbrial protein [Klebsiella spallanzanii]|uniref:fimbrial protein n=1 Tax=Klebsiella spallanzanii TaxID=2587528 RepID=UPI001157FD9D|nr:fimbrial protein [Klebsiella spallanzanii]VUS67897.1 Type-1 fimbrial protein, A chain [Klebsiella spallanzanii]
MKRETILGLSVFLYLGYSPTVLACVMTSGKTIEYSVNMGNKDFTVDVLNRQTGDLLFTYGGMTLTNNASWNINCSGSEPSGYKSIGGAPVGPAYQSKPGYVYSIDRLPGIGYSFQMGEQDGIDFDSLFMPYPTARPFSGDRYFNSESKKPTIYFWRIPDTSGLPPPGQYCLNDYLGDTYLDGVNALRFSVKGLCITVKSPTCKISNTDIKVNLGRHNRTVFMGPGSTTNMVPFNIDLTTCENVGNIFMQFNAMPDGNHAANGIIKIDDSGDDIAATGVGVQVLKNSVPIALNEPATIWSGSKGSESTYSFQYQARYIQTESTVTAGQANASATFVVTYN